VHINYYCKLRNGRYLGCEVALSEFSFVDGIRKLYHVFINPGDIPLGYAFMSRKRAEETRLIPVSPDGFGSESGKQEILENIKFFLT
jgi:hypothetical protein